jgi:phosphocarrier protein FPr/phosphocarrier protein
MTAVTLVAPCDGWLSPLGAVPDPVFSGCLLGDGVAIDPLGDVFHAPADGEVMALHEAGHAITLRLAPGLEMLIHVGLDTVRLGGRGSRRWLRWGRVLLRAIRCCAWRWTVLAVR